MAKYIAKVVLFIFIWLYQMFWVIGYSVVEKGIIIYDYSSYVSVGGVIALIVAFIIVSSIKYRYLQNALKYVFGVYGLTFLYFEWLHPVTKDKLVVIGKTFGILLLCGVILIPLVFLWEKLAEEEETID